MNKQSVSGISSIRIEDNCTIDIDKVPDLVMENLCRPLVATVMEYFRDPEAQREFAEFQQKQIKEG